MLPKNRHRQRSLLSSPNFGPQLFKVLRLCSREYFLGRNMLKLSVVRQKSWNFKLVTERKTSSVFWCSETFQASKQIVLPVLELLPPKPLAESLPIRKQGFCCQDFANSTSCFASFLSMRNSNTASPQKNYHS